MFVPALVGAGDGGDGRGDRASFEELGECPSLIAHERRLGALAEGCRGTSVAACFPFFHEPFAEVADMADGFADEGMAREPFAHGGVIRLQSLVIVGECGAVFGHGVCEQEDVVFERLGVGEGLPDGHCVGKEPAQGLESVEEEEGESIEDPFLVQTLWQVARRPFEDSGMECFASRFLRIEEVGEELAGNPVTQRERQSVAD